MSSRSASQARKAGQDTNAGEPMDMLVVQISDEGEPLMYKAESPASATAVPAEPSQHPQDSPGNIHHDSCCS